MSFVETKTKHKYLQLDNSYFLVLLFCHAYFRAFCFKNMFGSVFKSIFQLSKSSKDYVKT